MSFDEQPDPLSDAIDHIKKQEREIARLKAEVEAAKRVESNREEAEAAFRKSNPCHHPYLPVGFEDGLWHCCECWAEDEQRRAEAAERRRAEAVKIIKQMDCDCAGEGVGELGGCYRCLALSALTPAPQIAGEAKRCSICGDVMADFNNHTRRCEECGAPAPAPSAAERPCCSCIGAKKGRPRGAAICGCACHKPAAEGKAVTLTTCGQELWAGSTRYVCGMPDGHGGDHQDKPAASGEAGA